MKYSTDMQFNVDSVRLRLIFLRLNKIFYKSSISTSFDSSSPKTIKLPISCSSTVDFLQQFIYTTYFPVFQRKLLN